MTAALGAVLYNTLVVGAIWIGAWASVLLPWIRASNRAGISFSAGIFLGVAFLHMIPESAEILGQAAGLFVLGGFLLLYLLERFVMVHPCDEETCDFHKVGVAAFLGLSFHSLMNGVALGSALQMPNLGFSVFLATLFHKLPESFVLAGLLGLAPAPSRRRILAYIAVYSLMMPLGTLVAFLGLAPMGEKAIGAAVALSAGIFLQLATGDLLSEVHSRAERRLPSVVTLFAGAAVSVAVRLMGA